MEQQHNQASLKDVLNYNIDTYITDDDMALIRSTFKDNPRLLNVLRKVFLPTIGDSTLPVEEVSKDVFLQGRDWASIPDAEVKSLVVGRQEAIKFVAGGLIQLKVIANSDPVSPLSNEMRKQKDQTK